MSTYVAAEPVVLEAAKPEVLQFSHLIQFDNQTDILAMIFAKKRFYSKFVKHFQVVYDFPAAVSAPAAQIVAAPAAVASVAYAAAPAVAVAAVPQPVVHVHQPAPVMVKAPVIEQRVHYENRPVVAGYNSEIIKPNLGMGLVTPGMDNLVTKTAVKAPARTHTEYTEQITVQHPTKVNVEKINVEVPVAQPYAQPVPVPITPQVDVHHQAVPVVQQYTVAAAPVAVQAVQAAPAVAVQQYAAAPIVGQQLIGGVQEIRTGGLVGTGLVGTGLVNTGLIGGEIRTGLVGGYNGLIGGYNTGLVGGINTGLIGGEIRTGLVGGYNGLIGGYNTGLISGIPSGVIVQ